MRFPRVIRLDDSDSRVFEKAAQPSEWAVSGAFSFLRVDLQRADGKLREAFHHGFLGTESFGWSTLVQVDEIGDADYTALIERLATLLILQYGAPNLETARASAREEAEFAASICEHPLHTLLSVTRELGEEGIVEDFRVARTANPLDHARLKIWTIEKE